MLDSSGRDVDQDSVESALTGLTAAKGCPEIDNVSCISIEMHNKSHSVLDSEVKGMDRFANVNEPMAYRMSGRGKSSYAGSATSQQNESGMTNRLNESGSQNHSNRRAE